MIRSDVIYSPRTRRGTSPTFLTSNAEMHSASLPINSVGNTMLCLRSASYGPLDIVGLLNPVLGFKGGESNVYAPLSLMCGSGRMGKEGANRPRQQMKL